MWVITSLPLVLPKEESVKGETGRPTSFSVRLSFMKKSRIMSLPAVRPQSMSAFILRMKKDRRSTPFWLPGSRNNSETPALQSVFCRAFSCSQTCFRAGERRLFLTKTDLVILTVYIKNVKLFEAKERALM